MIWNGQTDQPTDRPTKKGLIESRSAQLNTRKSIPPLLSPDVKVEISFRLYAKSPASFGQRREARWVGSSSSHSTVSLLLVVVAPIRLQNDRVSQMLSQGRKVRRLLISFPQDILSTSPDDQRIVWFSPDCVKINKYTSNGGYRREEKSHKHWSLSTMLLSSVTEIC